MKKILYLTLISTILYSCNIKKQTETTDTEVTLEELWSSGQIFKIPESVLYDQSREVIFVANINGEPTEKNEIGFISQLEKDGKVRELEWVTGLNAPKGMGLYQNYLYVSDITDIKVIDIEKKEIVEVIEIPGSSFLNDITIGENGTIYITDSDVNVIYMVSNREITTWLEGDMLKGPNGLYFEKERLLLASFGQEKFMSIDLASKTVSIISDKIGKGDGIAKDKRNNYVVSSWEGELNYIFKDGRQVHLLDTREQNISAADIDMIVEDDVVLVPTFFDNRVVAYRLNFSN